MRALILGAGNMGRVIRDGLTGRGDQVVAMLGRPATERPEPASLAPIDVAFEFSHATSVLDNVRYALATGCRAIVLGTTGWGDDRAAVAGLINDADAALVDAPTYSLGAVLFGELAESAARLFGRFDSYDPYVLEWHRRTKADRPSGTAAAIAARMLPHLDTKSRVRLAEGQGAPERDTLEVVSLRAGASPGMHIVGFDAPGETLELQITARDRSAYVAGALLAADWLRAATRPAGIHPFDAVVRALLAEPPPGRATPPPTGAPGSGRGASTVNPAAASGLQTPDGGTTTSEATDVLVR